MPPADLRLGTLLARRDEFLWEWHTLGSDSGGPWNRVPRPKASCAAAKSLWG